MQTKKEMIQNLKNVKLVIGNGFDLYCNLKTKYSDYFLYDEEKNSYFIGWIRGFSYDSRFYIKFNTYNNKGFWHEFNNFEKANVWDFFFYLLNEIDEKHLDDWKWCDIEFEIEKSLNGNSKLNWPLVYKLLSGKRTINDAQNPLYILTAVCYKKNNEKQFNTEADFYFFLLAQLKEFEKNFGYYIFRQHYDDTYKSSSEELIHNEDFTIYSQQAINELCNPKTLVSIDSFNFDSIEVEELESIFHNINGITNSPIFGIDSDSFLPEDPRYIFTKTYRRMELDMLEQRAGDKAPFNNVIIFGHSLNAADYNYFFSLFDKIQIVNSEIDSKIIFEFNIYDEKKEEEIRVSQRNSIFKLFQKYSEYKGNESHPNRLLDYLTTQGKVIMYEVPSLNIPCKPTYFRK